MVSKKNIYLIFGAVTALLVLLTFVLVNQGERIKWHSTEIETNWLPGIESINSMHSAINNYRATEIAHAMTTEGSLKAEYTQTLLRFNKEFLEGKDKYEPTIRPYALKELALWKQYIKNYEDYMTASKLAMVMSQNNENVKAINHIKINQDLYDSVIEYAQMLVNLNTDAGYEEAQKGNQAYESAKMQLLAGLIIILISLIVIAFLLSNGPIKQQGSYAISKIRKNIALIFLTLIVAFCAYSFLIYQQLGSVNEQINQLKNNWLPSIVTINAISNQTTNYGIYQTLSLLTTNSDEKVQLENSRKLIAADISNLRKKYLTLISSDVERDLYNEFSTSFDEYNLSNKKIEDFSNSNEMNKALIENNQNVILKEYFSVVLMDLLRLNERGGIDTSYKNDAALESLKIITLGGISFIILLLIVTSQLVVFWLFNEAQDTGFESSSRTILTIKVKLRLVFFGMLGAFILFSWLINGLMTVLDDNSREIERNWLPSIIQVNQINKMISDYRIAESQIIFGSNLEEKLFLEKNRKRLINGISHIKDSYQALISSDRESAIFQEFSHNYTDYLKKSEVMLVLSSKNDTEGAIKAFQVNRIIFDAMTINLEKLVQLNAESGMHATQLNNRIFDESQQIIYAVVLVILMITILFMIIFDKNISLALQRLTSTVRSLAAGVLVSGNADLKSRHDEIGQMADAVDMVNNTLKALMLDANELVHAAEAGTLSVRVDDTRHPGEFKKIVAGMNTLIDILSKPLGDIAEIMQNLALGDLSERMKGDYEGELYILKTNVNRSLEALVSLLTELSQTMQYMANNDLTHHLIGNYQGEFSLLKASTNQTIAHMIEILQEITISTLQSAVAIEQTSESSKYVAREASQQMFAIENVAKAIDKTAVSVNEIAKNAQEGRSLARSTANFANEGQAQLNKLNDLIQLTDDITRIADKTHLLSLNAALEAMRAGEYGMGFGLVAQQIGTLAEEVTISAQKIRFGVNTLQTTQTAMEKIAHAAQSSEVNVESISVAIVQQSSAVRTITEQIDELRISSEASASAAEEISSTMDHLAQTVKETADKVKYFKLIEN
ncbi:MAG: hypothetical protein RLZ75_2672 [Pseudomonadota bacterium]|jgi:methyl-accepting chemotaxis protein